MAQDAKQLYLFGRLGEAIQAALTSVKSNPTDVASRLLLTELLCFQGEWDRAEKQLDAITKQSHDDGLYAALIRQLIRGEVLREQVFFEGRPPQIVAELPADAAAQLRLCVAIRDSATAELSTIVDEAQAARSPVSGCCNDAAFDDIRDLDDRIAGVAEVITTTGKYYWVPLRSIKRLEFAKPERPFDLIWRKASIEVDTGLEGEIFVPVRYPLTPGGAGWDDQLKLGRATTWSDHDGAVTGLGQRMLLVGDEAMSFMEIDTISASVAAES